MVVAGDTTIVISSLSVSVDDAGEWEIYTTEPGYIELRLHNNTVSQNAWDVLDALTGSVDAPVDWATQHDHYLYGTPKHDD